MRSVWLIFISTDMRHIEKFYFRYSKKMFYVKFIFCIQLIVSMNNSNIMK